jgi:hypothetical protein
VLSHPGVVIAHKEILMCINPNVIASYTPKRENKLNHHRRSSSSPLESSISSSTPSLIIITVPECENHFAVEMVSVSCTPNPFFCGNGFQNLQSHHQHRRSSSSPSSPYRNDKTILLWKTRCT